MSATELSSFRFSCTGMSDAVGSFCVITYHSRIASPSDTALSHKFSAARAATGFVSALRRDCFVSGSGGRVGGVSATRSSLPLLGHGGIADRGKRPWHRQPEQRRDERPVA